MLGGFLRRGHQGPTAALHSRGRAVSHTGTWHLPWVAGGCLAPTPEGCSPDTLRPPQRIFHNLPAPTLVGAAGPDPTWGHAVAWRVTAGEAGGVAGIQVRSPSPLGAPSPCHPIPAPNRIAQVTRGPQTPQPRGAARTRGSGCHGRMGHGWDPDPHAGAAPEPRACCRARQEPRPPALIPSL